MVPVSSLSWCEPTFSSSDKIQKEFLIIFYMNPKSMVSSWSRAPLGPGGGQLLRVHEEAVHTTTTRGLYNILILNMLHL